MQASASKGSFRRALLAVVAVVLLVVCGIGIAAAATAVRHGRPAAHKAKAAVGVVGKSGKTPVGVVGKSGKAPVGAVGPLPGRALTVLGVRTGSEPSP
jgi:hypothetical protein